MKKSHIIILVLTAVVVAGGWYARYRFGVPSVDPEASQPLPPGFINIAQAKLPVADYAKLPKDFPSRLILGHEAEVLDGRTRYLGGATLLVVRAKSKDSMEFLRAQYEMYFRAFGYTQTIVERNQNVIEATGKKGNEEIQVGIIRDGAGAILSIKYLVEFVK